MIAGTLARLESSADEPLETWFRDRGLPGIHVERTQSSFDDRPVQAGTAATRVEATEKRVDVGVSGSGTAVALDVTDEPSMETISTEWVADVTGSGLLAAASVNGDGKYPFPFDLFASVTDRDVERLRVDVSKLHAAWSAEDVLGDVWMVGSDDDQGASIDYHDRASPDEKPTIGMGFERPWSGTVERGVVYASGYVAVYSSNTASAFVRFVEEELLPYCETESEDSQQVTLGGGDAFADEVADHLEGEGFDISKDAEPQEWTPGTCDRCGHDRDRTQEQQGETVCLLCDEGVSGDA